MADSGFPIEPRLLTPFQDADTNSKEELYNEAHKSARNVIERCFGVLKSRFRCLLQHRTLHFSPKVASSIIYSVLVLHNICINNNIPLLEEDEEDEEEDVDVNGTEIEIFENNLLAAGRRLRQQYINNNF